MARAYTQRGTASNTVSAATDTTSISLTPQTSPIPGREEIMLLNNAGGFSFVLDDWERLNRFLILGSEGGTYYVSEKNLTQQNAEAVIRCIKLDGARVVQQAYDINMQNRAPKTDQQLFVLALVLQHGDYLSKMAAESALADMLRTGTHLLHMVAMIDSLGGWSRVKRRVIASWFQNRDADSLAYQMLKYQQRDGWSMRDALRMSHPTETTPGHKATYLWALGKDNGKMPDLPKVIQAYRYIGESVGTEQMTHVEAALEGIALGLPREALPTEAMQDPDVWRVQIKDVMPLHALLRNLRNIAIAGVAEYITDTNLICDRLLDAAALRRSRVHPFAILLAMLMYKDGKTDARSDSPSRSSAMKTWGVSKKILSALEDAYDAAFQNVPEVSSRVLIAVDTSQSMSQVCIGTPVRTSTAAAAMAITLARSMPNSTVVHFDVEVNKVVPVTNRTGIAAVESASGGGTDLNAPVRWACGTAMTDARYDTAYRRGWRSDSLRAPQFFDAFIILTDNETWAGEAHTSQVLELYRRNVNPKAKLICCSMAANHANIVDPADAGSMGTAGLDANLPAMVADFISREAKEEVR